MKQWGSWDTFAKTRREFEPAELVWNETLQPQLSRMQEARNRRKHRVLAKTLAGFVASFLFVVFAGTAFGASIGVAAQLATVILVFPACIVIPLLASTLTGSGAGEEKHLIVKVAAAIFGVAVETGGERLRKQLTGPAFLGFRLLAVETPSEAMTAFKAVSMLNWTNMFARGDAISGQLNDVAFEFEEVSLTDTQQSVNRAQTYATLSFDWSMPSQTRIVLAEKGRQPRARQGKPLRSLEVGPKSIRSSVDIYTDDPVLALSVLTPDIMERWQEVFSAFAHGSIQATYADGKLHLLLKMDNLFEASVGKASAATDEGATFRRVLTEIALIVDVVKALTTRDWAIARVEASGTMGADDASVSDLSAHRRKQPNRSARLLFGTAAMFGFVVLFGIEAYKANLPTTFAEVMQPDEVLVDQASTVSPEIPPAIQQVNDRQSGERLTSEEDPLLRPMNQPKGDDPAYDLTAHFNFGPSEPKVVQADVLRIRAAPNAEADHIANLRYGDVVYERQIKGDEDSEWVEVAAQLQGAYLLRRAIGFVPRRFLVDAEYLKAPDELAADIDLSTSGEDRLRAAERLYAVEPSPENLRRLRDIHLGLGNQARADQLTALEKSPDDRHLAMCHEGELIWLTGGPYENDVWRGNYANVRGRRALELNLRSYQGQPWYRPVKQPMPPSYETDRSIRWPWRAYVSSRTDPETLGASGYVVAAWETEAACAFGRASDFYANFPISPVSISQQAMTEEMADIIRASDPDINMDGARAYAIDSTPSFVLVALASGLESDGKIESIVILSLDEKKVTGRVSGSYTDTEHIIERLAAVLNGVTGVTYLVARTRESKDRYWGGPPAVDTTVALKLFTLGKDNSWSRGIIPLRIETAGYPDTSKEYPYTMASETRSLDETYTRGLNGHPEPEALKRPTPPARRERAEEDRLAANADVSALFDHRLAEFSWRGLDPRWTGTLSFYRPLDQGYAHDEVLQIDLPALDADGTEIGKWVRIELGKWPNNWNGSVESSAIIGERGYYPEKLANIRYGKGVQDLVVYGQSGARYLLTPPGADAVYIEIPESDTYKVSSASRIELLEGAQELHPNTVSRPVLRAEPSDDATILPEAHIGEFTDSSHTDKTTRIFPAYGAANNGDWVRVSRETYAPGAGPDIYCGGEGADPLEVSEGWIRWRAPDGTGLLDFSDGVTC
ncbi:MAG: DUF3137 domain-containing protein [Pseudomonadota bacterium]